MQQQGWWRDGGPLRSRSSNCTVPGGMGSRAASGTGNFLSMKRGKGCSSLLSPPPSLHSPFPLSAPSFLGWWQCVELPSIHWGQLHTCPHGADCAHPPSFLPVAQWACLTSLEPFPPSHLLLPCFCHACPPCTQGHGQAPGVQRLLGGPGSWGEVRALRPLLLPCVSHPVLGL